MSAELFGVGPPADVVSSHHATADTDKNTARRPAAVVQRTVFASPRAAEFLELRALQAQTGQPADAFGDVVVKELLDNALDAAESAGRAPIIEITVIDDEDVAFVTVTDNGAGIAAATVDDIADFTVLASDNAKYRGPARGAQGNALKTLLGIPFALDVTAPVVIDSEGVRHEPAVHLGAGGDVVVEHETSASDRTVGASVTVPLPETLELDPYRLGEAPTNRGGRPRNTSCTRTSAP